MLSKSIRILDFDASLSCQQKIISAKNPEVIDFSDFSSCARLWMDKETKRKVDAKLSGLSKEALTFTGSGDFHHISSSLISRFKDPLSLIVFDFHPDWDIFPPRYGCGSWVSRALEQENILKCVLIGPSSEDLSWPGLQSGNLEALKEGKLEIYPYAHKRSFVSFRDVPESVCVRTKKTFLGTRICWEEIGGRNLEDFFSALLARLPTKKVYVSIDKDCLKKEYALTNWEEGKLTLDELLLMIRMINRDKDIAGMDITGEYSLPRLKNKAKDFFLRLDHPENFSAKGQSPAQINAVNEKTNLRILECLGL